MVSFDLDRYLLQVFEKVLLWVQDHLGIPKWKLLRVVVLAHCVLFISGGILESIQSFVFHLILGGIVGLVWWRPEMSKEQQKADDSQQIIKNLAFSHGLGKLLRFIVIVTFVFSLAVAFRLANQDFRRVAVLNLFLVVMFYLSSLHTYPMVGPLFKERLKNLFRVSQFNHSVTNER